MTWEITEADWKVFKKVRETALQRFSQRILDEMKALAEDKSRTPHERYLAVWKMMHKRNREIADAFDNMRRSAAKLQLLMMYRTLELIEPRELAPFSEEIRAFLEADLWRGVKSEE